MHERPSMPDEMLNRGVYLAPYLVKGCPALVAIDPRRWAVKHFLLRPASNHEYAWTWMERWLDRYYPSPQLQLVREAPLIATPAPTAVVRPAIDPRAYEDHLTFALRLAQRFAQQHRPYE